MKYAIFCVKCERWVSLHDLMPVTVNNELRNVIPLFPDQDLANSALRRATNNNMRHAKTCEIIALETK